MRRWIILGSCAAALVWLRPAHADRLTIDFISVGQGDAALIRSPTGKTVLIDGGPPEGADALTSALKAALHGPLDLIVLTHRHVDHLGGLSRVLDLFGARLYLDAPYPHPSPFYRRLLAALQSRGTPVKNAVAGRRIELGDGAMLELLGPPEPPLSHTRSDVNANSVVSRLDYRRMSVLFAADAEKPTEERLLAAGARLKARVLKVAHHGSRYSSTLAFLRAVQPELAIVSVGVGNSYHHPGFATLDRLRAVGARVLRTDEHGTISLTSDGEAYQVRTAREEIQ